MELEDIIIIATRAIESVLAFVGTTGDFSAITNYKERDVTRRFDLVAEQKLQDELFERGVSARIVSEEYGDRIVGDDPSCTFVFDPIDGSTNVAIGFPYFCSSLAYAPRVDDISLSDITMGAVVTNSLDVYAAERGKGARLNGVPLVTRTPPRYKPVPACSPDACAAHAYAPRVDDISLSDITMGAVVTNSLDVYAAERG